MTTIDNILFKIEMHGIDCLPISISGRDKKILASMAKMIKTQEYITESQANLTVKVLRENLEHLNFVGSELILSLKLPRWSRIFKTIEKTRKISISFIENQVPVIEIEASYKKELKKAIFDLEKNREGDIFAVSDKKYHLLLTEKNLVKVVDTLKQYNFKKSQEISDIYDKIKNIDCDEIKKKFDIEHTDNERLKTLLLTDSGDNSMSDALLLQDRKIAYQYQVNKTIHDIDESSLLYKIATRKNHKIFIDNQQFSLKGIDDCLTRLNKKPMLLMFDEYNTKNCIESLKQLKNLLDETDFSGNVGIYFRFDNNGDGIEFNKLISEYGFNKKLDTDTQIAVLSNGKLPKFFLKSDWYPKTVISFTNHFRNNKTAVYCNSCDLIIYYTPSIPAIGNVDAIV